MRDWAEGLCPFWKVVGRKQSRWPGVTMVMTTAKEWRAEDARRWRRWKIDRAQRGQ